MRSLAAALLLAALPASALEVAGVKVADSITVDGKALVLNGAGLRTRTFLAIKVYVGALYVTQRSTDAAAIVALDAPKVIRMTLLRDVDRASMLTAFRDGIENNSPTQAAALAPKLKQVEAAFPAEFKEKQVLAVSYVPGTGTTVGVEGEKGVTIEGKDFADALFRIWIGPKPTDGGLEDLKAALLSGK
jgi:hypothetical protein